MPPRQTLQVSRDAVVKAVAHQIERAIDDEEARLDAEAQEIQNMDQDGLEDLREKRRKEWQMAKKRKELFDQLGHGVYTEVSTEKEIFEASSRSAKVICHFYKPDQNIERKEIMDKHLTALAPKFIDIRFLTINVERSPFLVQRLGIFVLPSLIFIKEQKMFHTMLGFEELDRRDDFTTDMLVRVLRKWGMTDPYDPEWKDRRKELIPED